MRISRPRERARTTRLRLAGGLVVAAALIAYTAGTAAADPPGHPRFAVSPAHVGLTHEPEIIGGLAPPDVRDHRLVAQLMAQAGPLTTPQSGFSWGDAGIGAGATVLLLAFLSATTLFMRGYVPGRARCMKPLQRRA